MFVLNTWYIAAWSEDVADKPFPRRICNEAIVFFRDQQTGKVAALAGLLLALRGAGMALGWGFQFTSPVFVLAIAWLMLAVGLNLSGVFALGGPIGAGGHLAARGGFWAGRYRHTRN